MIALVNAIISHPYAPQNGSVVVPQHNVLCFSPFAASQWHVLLISHLFLCLTLPTRDAQLDSIWEADAPTALRDVTPERFSKLEKELVRGKGEVVSQSNIIFYCNHLAVQRCSLPQASSAGSSHFTSSVRQD